MTIVSQYNKEMDTTYVYESESYYDPEKKQSRSRRKLIGKIDKETGEIVPTGRRGPKKKSKDQPVEGVSGTKKSPSDGSTDRSYADQTAMIGILEERIGTQEKEINILKSRLATLEDENTRLRELSTDTEQMKRGYEHMCGILRQIRKLTDDMGGS